MSVISCTVQQGLRFQIVKVDNVIAAKVPVSKLTSTILQLCEEHASSEVVLKGSSNYLRTIINTLQEGGINVTLVEGEGNE